MVLLVHYSTTVIYRTTKTTNRVKYKGKLRLKTGKLQMEVQNGIEYDWRKIEELLQPSTRIRKLQWIRQTATSQPIIKYLGKRNGPQHDRNDRIVLTPRSAYPTWDPLYLTSRIPIKLRTYLISPKFGLSSRSNPRVLALVYKGYGPKLTYDSSALQSLTSLTVP
jgi:hypothetical protein